MRDNNDNRYMSHCSRTFNINVNYFNALSDKKLNISSQFTQGLPAGDNAVVVVVFRIF